MTSTHGSHGSATFRLRDRGLADLPTALDWLREHWDGQRTAPARLTVNDTEGELGGLRYSGAFSATLGWEPRQATSVTYTAICSHPMTHGRGDDCPECQGAGVTDRTAHRYPYPMSTALWELRKETALPGFIPTLAVIYALASAGFRPRVAMQLLGITDEAVLLAAIRRLFGKYQAGPVASVGWTQISESQQNAVMEGEAA